MILFVSYTITLIIVKNTHRVKSDEVSFSLCAAVSTIVTFLIRYVTELK
jgi:hypothetical protein